MKVGTKSILFGAHQFLIHPLFVAWAWFQLFGFPWDIRLWVAFVVHDWGYWGKPNMDGPEGESHPTRGAAILSRLFDRPCGFTNCDGVHRRITFADKAFFVRCGFCNHWYDFAWLHSRHLAKKHNLKYSRLCAADKLASALEPSWLYLPRVILTGEIKEYMSMASRRHPSRRAWHKAMKDHCRKWAWAHRDGEPDTVTPATRKASPLGVHQ